MRNVRPHVRGIDGLVIIITVQLAAAADGAPRTAILIHGALQVALAGALPSDGHPLQIKPRFPSSGIHQDTVMLAAEMRLGASAAFVSPDDLIHESPLTEDLVTSQSTQRAAPPIQMHVKHARVRQKRLGALRQPTQKRRVRLVAPLIVIPLQRQERLAGGPALLAKGLTA